jgi:hypothetical protein
MIYVNFEIPELKADVRSGANLSAVATVDTFKDWLKANPRRLMMSHTEGGFWGAGSGQFRIWDGLPSSFEAGHVDSCGKNMLLHVAGDHWAVREFRDRFAQAFPHLRPVMLPNNTILYLHFYLPSFK